MKVKKILKTIYVVGIFGLLIAIGIKTFVGKSNSPAKEEKESILQVNPSLNRHYVTTI